MSYNIQVPPDYLLSEVSMHLCISVSLSMGQEQLCLSYFLGAMKGV